MNANKTPCNFWAFSARIPSFPPFQGVDPVDRAMKPATLRHYAASSAWCLGPAPALSAGGIYLHDTCCQKNSHIGTFSAPIPVTSLFIRGLATLGSRLGIAGEASGEEQAKPDAVPRGPRMSIEAVTW